LTTSSDARDVVRGVGAEKGLRVGGRRPLFARRRLAELIAVALVLGVILYLFIPTLAGTGESARRTTCTAHLRRLAQLAAMYVTDYEAYPPTETWVQSLYPLLTDRDGTAILFCPSEESLPRPLRKHNWVNSSYSYRNPSPTGVVQDEAGTAAFWDYLGGSGAGAHPHGGNVVYLDGHVTWLPHDRWRNSDLP
jgi:prepilin-type processing-associated H-X9-DG protein